MPCPRCWVDPSRARSMNTPCPRCWVDPAGCASLVGDWAGRRLARARWRCGSRAWLMCATGSGWWRCRMAGLADTGRGAARVHAAWRGSRTQGWARLAYMPCGGARGHGMPCPYFRGWAGTSVSPRSSLYRHRFGSPLRPPPRSARPRARHGRAAGGVRGRPQPAAGRCGHGRRRPDAHHRGRRDGQNAHARLPRRLPHRDRHAGRADRAPDVHAPRRQRNARPRGAPARRPLRPRPGRHVPRLLPGGAAPARAPDRLPAPVHAARPRRRRRRAGPAPHRGRPPPVRAPLPEKAHPRRHVLRRHQPRPVARNARRRGVPAVLRPPRRIGSAARQLRRLQAPPRPGRLRRPARAHRRAPPHRRRGPPPRGRRRAPRAGGRIPGREPAPGRDRAPARVRPRRRHGRRRRRAEHLPLPRRRRAAHLRLPGDLPRHAHRAAGGELPLHPAHPRPRESRARRREPEVRKDGCSPTKKAANCPRSSRRPTSSGRANSSARW